MQKNTRSEFGSMLKESAAMSHRICLMLTALFALNGAPAVAAGLNALSDLKVVPTPKGAQVVVAGSKAPTFTVFRLSEPDRLVVDLSSADISGIKGHHDGAGPVAGIVASQFADERASVGRILVGLNKAAQYDVRADGNRVVISVEGAMTSEPPSEKPAQAEAPAAAVDAGSKEKSPSPVGAEPSKASDDVVASESDERQVKAPAKRVIAVRSLKSGLSIAMDGELSKYELLELANPPRLALDLYGVKLVTKVARIRSQRIRDVRAGSHDDKVRLVVDIAGEMPGYRIARSKRGIEVVLSSKPKAPAAHVAQADGAPVEVEIDGQKVSLPPEPASAGNAAMLQPAPPEGQLTALAEVKELSFDDSPKGGRVELKLSSEAKFRVERPDDRSAVLTLEGARIPKKLERSLDTSALDTPVKMISAFAVPGDSHQVRVVVAALGKVEESVVKTRDGLSWQLSVAGVKTEDVQVSQKTAGFSAEAPAYAAQGTPRRPRFVGKKVSFEFKDIDIHNLLRIIAEVSKKNIVVADDVKGTVTIRLRNVPWDQALELILRSKSLGKEDLGNNIIRVAPLKTLEEESKLREERKRSLIRLEDLVVQLIPVNYANAGEMSARVKDVLSERGTVTVDARTNVLIVRDVGSNIGKARSLVTQLDTQTPQVLIESRIVEAATTFTRQIGVQWGGQAQAAPGTGNPTGLVFPNVVSVRGGSSPDSNAGTADVPNFAVNLPAAVGAGSGGALGFVFGSAGGAVGLNLRLSALENQGSVKTISAPKVTTLDNITARISQGVSIPFSQVSAGGVNTTFIEARLSLEVTPHITQDGSIMMQIRAENNQPDPSNTGANGQPAIQRKEANTNVLVKDGDTTVIGGIYVRRGATSEARVPFFSKIPILGFFFKNNTESDARQELLIFITPRIINRQTIAQTL